ncbi:hypothetical protein BGX31_004853, partial [Mortierella sp. GBA43]
MAIAERSTHGTSNTGNQFQIGKLCPSCCFSCEKLSDLKDHVVSEHRPKEKKKHDMDEDSEERSTKRAKSVSIA